MRERAPRAKHVPGKERAGSGGAVSGPTPPVPVFESGAQRGQRALRWIDGHSADIFPRYAGQWIAVDDDALVAVAPDLPTVMRIASEQGHRLPFVMQVPTKPLANLAVLAVGNR